MVGCCEVDCTWKYAGASPRKKTRKSSAGGGEPWPIRCTDRASLAAGGEIVEAAAPIGGNVTKGGDQTAWWLCASSKHEAGATGSVCTRETSHPSFMRGSKHGAHGGEAIGERAVRASASSPHPGSTQLARSQSDGTLIKARSARSARSVRAPPCSTSSTHARGKRAQGPARG